MGTCKLLRIAALIFIGLSVLCSSSAYADCTSPAGEESRSRWDFTTHTLYYCYGTTWVSLSGASVAGSTGQIQFNNGSNALAADAALTWDNTNKYLGIGVVVPMAKLQVGSVTSGTAEATRHGLIQIQGSPDLNVGNNGLEFKASSASNGYGWLISGPDRLSGNAPLVFAYRNNSATWTELMTMRSDTGNVGINTTSPQAKLETQYSASRYVRLNDLTETGTFATGTRSTFRSDDNGAPSILAIENLDVTAAILHGTSILSRMSYTSGANAPINAGRIIFVKENEWTSMASTQNSALQFGTTVAGTMATKMTISSAGNVGIGTGAPGAKLDVNGNARIASDLYMQNDKLIFWGNSNTAYVAGADATTASNLKLGTNGNEALRILASGNIGIGTTTPGVKLEVAGGTLRLVNEDNWNSIEAYNLSAAKYSVFRGARGRGTLASPTSAQAGDILTAFVGYGYDAPSTTAYAGGMIIGAETTFSTAVNGFIAFHTNLAGTASEKVRITAAGNVGIGTASPGYKLHVAETKTDTAATSNYMTRDILTITPASDSASNFVSHATTATVTGSSNITSWTTGTASTVTHTGSGTLSSIFATDNEARNTSTGTVTTSYGAYNISDVTGAGTTTTAIGAKNTAQNYSASGSIGTAYGSYNMAGAELGPITTGYGTYDTVFNSTSGTITNAYGARARVQNTSTGIITNAYNLYADLSNSGTVTNWYGLYVQAVSGTAPATSRYPIYVADTGNNYFAGNVGIGTTTPGTKLEVSGDAGIRLDASGYRSLYMGSISSSSARTSRFAKNYDSPYDLNFYNSTNTSHAPIYFFTDNGTTTARMMIQSGGNVGIGTTTPSTPLEVVGNVTATAYLYTSDRRLKTDIEPLTDQLEKIVVLEPVSYTMKADVSRSPHLGLIAQDTEVVYPEIVHTGADGMKAIDYASLVGPLVAAVKELKAANDNQATENAAQGVEIEALKTEIEALRAAR